MKIQTLNFDEVNAMSEVRNLFDVLKKLNKEAYLKIAQYYYTQINHERKPTMKWVENELKAYDEVTKYVYENETLRKQDRLVEIILAGAVLADFTRAFNLWWSQTDQYALNTVHNSRVQAYKDTGVTKVIWRTMEDERTCKECEPRDGKVYSIDELPPRHYGCRCYLEEYERD